MLGHTLLLGPLGTEEAMRRQWHVRREAVERPDAQGRWDRAYQDILRWSLENERGHEQACVPSANGKEEYYEGSGLCPGLDLKAGQAPDDRAATGEGAGGRVGVARGGRLPRRRLQRHDSQAPGTGRPARQGKDAGARDRRGALSGPPRAQLRPPDGPHRGVREEWL